MMRRAATVTFASLLLALSMAGCTDHIGGVGVRNSADDAQVEIAGLQFHPVTLTVPAGTTVTWVNQEMFGHTVSPVDADAWGLPTDAASNWVEAGESWSFTFTEPGTYGYYSAPYATQAAAGAWTGMAGTVVVTAA